MVSATVCNIKQETPSTKSFDLVPTSGQIHFLPGQWIDFSILINGRQEVAGYSLTSSPTHKSSISLAVKDIGDDLVTRYIHDSMVNGDTVSLRVGGTCTYGQEQKNTLLLAGGIGITPIVSIFKYIAEHTPYKALLFHSVSSGKEFLFHEEIRRLCAQQPDRLYYRQTITTSGNSLFYPCLTLGRITEKKLKQINLPSFDSVFLCGPDTFISDLSEVLIKVGFNKNQIYYEKWW